MLPSGGIKSESKALHWQRSTTTKVQTNVSSLSSCWGTSQCLRALQNWTHPLPKYVRKLALGSRKLETGSCTWPAIVLRRVALHIAEVVGEPPTKDMSMGDLALFFCVVVRRGVRLLVAPHHQCKGYMALFS